ncbi:uncharacterized protein UPF0158 [Halanaerobium sp. DL-01]|uniref:UPF0158 family protein n=1 Tax=Halanaerobium sp. DL-01 TaxID=1653064 RepID=UPI000DF36829|nr:UPF0158 family protein [Halanaerobium sp. DL-01]RCW78896.1 uncharacterized protein UPF0158 [Halanaerobium sp. DL-01]
MTLKVNLEDVLEALELRTRESNYFYYKKTGEVFMIMDDELRAGEEDPDLDKFPEWQRENIKAAVDIISTNDYIRSFPKIYFQAAKNGESPDDYIRLPDDYEIDDYSIMEDFCYSVEDEELREELLYAIRGNGAFRMFKDKIYQYDLEDQWYDYKDQRYKDIAITQKLLRVIKWPLKKLT